MLKQEELEDERPDFTDDQLIEIRNRTSIVEIVSGYTKLNRVGNSHIGNCPFHEKDLRSLTVSEKAGLFHCFGRDDEGFPCGGGNVFIFLARVESISFPEAVLRLAAKLGIAPSQSKED